MIQQLSERPASLTTRLNGFISTSVLQHRSVPGSFSWPSVEKSALVQEIHGASLKAALSGTHARKRLTTPGLVFRNVRKLRSR